MIFKQYYLPSLSHASYLIGDTTTGTALVVDPQRDVDQYLQDAEKDELSIQYVFLTHFHADFVAGHLELQERTGATICLGAAAQADYPFQPLSDGENLQWGSVRLQVLTTPGHSPESICLLLFDTDQHPDKPFAVLSGDTLLIGDVGRPDLGGSHDLTPETLAGDLYDSLHNKILCLPDDTMVYPAHGQGTLCASLVQPDLSSTLGIQKQTNEALKESTKEGFIRRVTAHVPETLPYFHYDACLNARNRLRLPDVLTRALNPLTLDQVLRWKTSRAQLLDVRDPEDFAKGHLVGSLNIGLKGKFEQWAGTLLQPETPIIVIAAPGQAREAVLRLARIGLDHVAGYLKDGTLALKATPELIQTTSRITSEELEDCLKSPTHPYILDVRTPEEWAERKIGTSVNIPLNHLSERLHELPLNQDIIVYCSSGYRSAIASSLLQQHDICRIKDLVGGFEDWEHRVMDPSWEPADLSSQTGGR